MKTKIGLFCIFMAWFAGTAFSGGLGHNMLILVNGNNEESIRVAHAYQQLRHIPDENFIFIDPIDKGRADTYWLQEDVAGSTGTKTEFSDTFRIPIENHLAAHPHLHGQIDYIGMIDLPYRTQSVSSFTKQTATSGLLSALDLISTDPTNPNFYGKTLYTSPFYSIPYVAGQNPAIHHSTIFSNMPSAYIGSYYMGGMVAHTGFQGNSADDAIRSIQRAVNADGAHPVGTVYFEENDDIRSNIREPGWAVTTPELTARGVPWVESRLTPGSTPKNRSDVRGAICGSASLILPNGSIYLPGSYADTLTSYSLLFSTVAQFTAKGTRFIASGAAGTAGTVNEPGGTQTKFTHPLIHAMIDDGSTLGEAYHMSLRYGTSSVSTFLGDMLAQPYADVPVVQFDAGAPVEGSTVGGVVSIPASATVVASGLTTAVAELRLYIDGRLTNTLSGASGSFNLDTATVSDGWHELRVVGMNNSQAASEGLVLRGVYVDNHGRSLTAPASIQNVADNGVLAVPLAATAGDGTVGQLELRQMGRVLATVVGASGNAALDATQLAYGTNVVLATALFSDGTEVASAPLTVVRGRNTFPAIPAPRSRGPGLKGEYFFGGGGPTIPTSDFSGTPDVTVEGISKLNVGVFSASSSAYTKLTDGYEAIVPHSSAVATPTDRSNLPNLAARYTTYFTVPEAGEYSFFFYYCNDSGELLIDGQPLMDFYGIAWGTISHWGKSAFLAAGTHKVEVKMAKTAGNFFDTAVYMRGPSGFSEVISNRDFFFERNLPTGTFLQESFDGATRPNTGVAGDHRWVNDVVWTTTIVSSPDASNSGQVARMRNPGALHATAPYVDNTVVETVWQVALPSGTTSNSSDLRLLNENGEGYVFRAGLDQTGSTLSLTLFRTPNSGATLLEVGSVQTNMAFAADAFQDFGVQWDQTQGTFSFSINGVALGASADGNYATFSEVFLFCPTTSFILIDDVTVAGPVVPFDSIPFHETFENTAPMAGVLGPLQGQNRWSTTADSAVVQSNQTWEFDQAVSISGAEISRQMAFSSTNVWVAFAWKPVASDPVDPAGIEAGAATVFWLGMNGTLSAYSNQAVVDLLGVALDTNQWTRVVILADYLAAQWSLWLDGTQVIDRFGFYTNVVGNTIKVAVESSGASPVFIDDLHVTSTAWNPQPGDSDNDGLADDWELAYFQSPNILSNGVGDYDSDGLADGGEAVAGTDPTDSQSVFAITDAQTETAGGYILRWSSIAGRLYTVEASTNLLENSWVNVASNIAATPPENVYTSQVNSAESQFSRILVRQQQ